MSSNRKVHSRGNVPFSWEAMPGVSKLTHHDHRRPDVAGLNDVKIPLPPAMSQPPGRSSSRKGMWQQEEDPFLAALKECTKSVGNVRENKKASLVFKVMASKLRFSCKNNSCEVEDDNLVRLGSFPPLPRERLYKGVK